MKKHFLLLMIAVAAMCCPDLYAQVTVYLEDFETDGEGTRYYSNTFNSCFTTPDDNPDYFFRTKSNPVTPGGTCTSGFADVLTSLQGEWFWAAEDVRSTWPVPLALPPGALSTQAFSIAGYTDLAVSLYLATSGNTGDRWEQDDSINIQVSMDGGDYVTVGRFMGDDIAGGNLRIDGDLDGVITASDPVGICDMEDFTQYVFTVPGSGNSLSVRLDFDEAGDSEEVAIDHIELTGIPIPAPELNVTGNGITISDGDATPGLADFTDFGNVPVCTGSMTRIFTVENAGSMDLALDGVFIGGPAAADYTVTLAPISPVPAGGSTNFEITFDPSAVGARDAIITMANNDDDESSFDFVITGMGEADTTAPVAVCQNVVLYLDASGNTSLLPAWLDGGSTDNCALAADTAAPLPMDCNHVGATNYTYIVYDLAGNSDSCVSMVTVLDTIAPDALCRDVTVYLDAGGMATLTGPEVDNGSTDACGLADMILSSTDFDCSHTGIQVVTMTVSDIYGNTSTCTSNVTVTDTIGPALLCKDTGVDLGTAGVAIITPWMLLYSASDVCGIDTMTVSHSYFTCGDIGLWQDTLMVTDIHGNTSTCVSSVTIMDMTPPDTRCKDITLYLDALGSASMLPADIDSGSTDGCGISSLVASATIFTCADTGVRIVTLVATDPTGNSSNCTSFVTVVDTVAPIALCKDTLLYLDATGEAHITGDEINNGSSDNCSFGVSLSAGSFTCTDIGATTVTLYVIDASGNTSTCTGVVTVMDTLAPTAVCKDFLVSLDSAGTASITAADINNGSSDGCGISSITASPTDFTCADAGPNPVVLTVTDMNGNTSACTSTVTVSDDIAPVVLCKDITIYLKGSGLQSILPSDMDNGSHDNCGIDSMSVTESIFTCADVGSGLVTLVVYDAAGNAGYCTATVTVMDTSSPAVICRDITLYLNASGTATVTPAQIDSVSTDACGIAGMSLTFALATLSGTFTCSELGANPVTLHVTDVNGNTSSCVSNVTVADTLPPVAHCTFQTVYLDSAGSGTIAEDAVDNGSTDNCGVNTLDTDITFFDCTLAGPNTVTLTVTDLSGNSASCTATVTVVDATPPAMACHDITVTLSGSGFALVTGGMVDAGSTDNCGLAALWVSQDTFTCANIGMFDIILYASDPSGNTASCTATVEVTGGAGTAPLDLGPDRNWCPGDLFTLYAGPGFASYAWSEGSVTDSLVVSVPMSYSVTVVNAFGCVFSDTVEILDYVIVDGLVTTDGPAVLCLDGVLTLHGPAGCGSYEWSTGETSRDIEVTAGGWYSVYATDPDGCRQLDSIYVSTVGIAAPNVVVSPGGTVNVCDAVPVTLDAGAGYDHYWWSNGDTTQVVTVMPGSSYCVVASNSFGCRDSSEWVAVVLSDSVDAVLTLTSGTLYAAPTGTGYTYEWYRDGIILAGETDDELTPTVNGNYKVEVTQSGGCMGSDSLDYMLVGTEGPETPVWEVFPNPSNGNITIRSSRVIESGVTIRVTDMSGRVLTQQEINRFSGEMALDLTQLPAGIYHLEVNNQGLKESIKLVIQ